MTTYPATCWGDPSSKKRALLLHGLTSASSCWWRVAAYLTAQGTPRTALFSPVLSKLSLKLGYYVAAPDLIGHGLGPRPTSYTLSAFASALRSFVAPSQQPWDVLCGHSLGGLVALHLLPFMPSLPRLVLVDPPLEMSPLQAKWELDAIKSDFANPKSTLELQRLYPRWTEWDAIIRVYGEAMCFPAGVDRLVEVSDARRWPFATGIGEADITLQENCPWSFTHLLPPPSVLEVVILAAHSERAFSAAEAHALTKSRPDIKQAVIKNTRHSVHRDDPDEVARWVVEGHEKRVGVAPVLVEGRL